MSLVRLLPLTVLVALLVLPGSAGAARNNPYTAAGVCGAGFKPIDRRQLVDSNFGVRLATVVLTYNTATGRNCVVVLKRYRVGQTSRYGDRLYAQLYTRPLRNPANLGHDQGNFRYYAGPVYVTAPGKCVQWGGGASLLVPANWTPRGQFHSAFRSRWSHCG
jgi:hypothetical protein